MPNPRSSIPNSYLARPFVIWRGHFSGPWPKGARRPPNGGCKGNLTEPLIYRWISRSCSESSTRKVPPKANRLNVKFLDLFWPGRAGAAPARPSAARGIPERLQSALFEAPAQGPDRLPAQAEFRRQPAQARLRFRHGQQHSRSMCQPWRGPAIARQFLELRAGLGRQLDSMRWPSSSRCPCRVIFARGATPKSGCEYVKKLSPGRARFGVQNRVAGAL